MQSRASSVLKIFGHVPINTPVHSLGFFGPRVPLSEYTALAKELGEKKSQLTSANTEILEYKNMLSPRGVIEYFEKLNRSEGTNRTEKWNAIYKQNKEFRENLVTVFAPEDPPDCTQIVKLVREIYAEKSVAIHHFDTRSKVDVNRNYAKNYYKVLQAICLTVPCDIFPPEYDEMPEVLTEIAKVYPEFEKHEWLRFCEKEMIPNILKAVVQMNLEVLQDWCYERAFNMIATGINKYLESEFHTRDSKVIDVSKVELVSGKMTKQGPALVITFQVNMLHVVKNREGKVIEGDPNNAIRVHHLWVLCRDMKMEEFKILNPATEWKLLELRVHKGIFVV